MCRLFVCQAIRWDFIQVVEICFVSQSGPYASSERRRTRWNASITAQGNEMCIVVHTGIGGWLVVMLFTKQCVSPLSPRLFPLMAPVAPHKRTG